MQAGISWSNALVAIAIGILAFVRTSGAYGQAWMSWLNAIFGLWVFFSQWIIASFVGSAVVPQQPDHRCVR